MTIPDPANTSRLRLGLYMWVAGMFGVLALTMTVIPQLVADAPLGVPLWLVQLVSVAQSALLVALAVWLGVVLAPKVGLRATVFEAAVTAGSITSALRPQILPGLIGGVVGGVALFAIGGYASPAVLADVEQQFVVPILARVLYGGVTEELLLRWGLMTVLVWLAWRFLQRRSGTPQPAFIWLAIIVSALLFGAGHLPAAAVQVGQLTGYVVLFVIGANAVFGVLFGYLYWRYGLESAIIAHATAHAVSYALSLGAA
ncbi:CPBP family intramembrane glutamic endopeptidase [Pseudohongiella sp.]|uniref:CAAX prenyl protease 2/Lysostaphin resistance protein A-like domain-containing protein n=1 Tax=marine sediment metagenome TaxID=412755 RepID=A0A0F9YAH8_9ZZZZ|nr:CPBP family intramembrane glutamic endopeptidase [Pseudohongiella sp.]HDZ07997.1 CPBP family intramembrane metalloprotease [Pseudohongiella sp.]HEA64160.1 CPBP family intramembrane metalloprotease [Pseudohongiella sp.]